VLDRKTHTLPLLSSVGVFLPSSVGVFLPVPGGGVHYREMSFTVNLYYFPSNPALACGLGVYDITN